MDYKNVLGIGIPDLLLNLFSYHIFLKNNDSFFILICPKRISGYYFNKGFVIFEFDEYHFFLILQRSKTELVQN